MNRRRLTKSERNAIYLMFDRRCAYCGAKITCREMQIDHVVPLYNGGADDIDNMLPACRSCNKYKSTMTLEKFRAAVERMPEVLNRDNATFRIAMRFGVIQPGTQKVKFYFERRNEA